MHIIDTLRCQINVPSTPLIDFSIFVQSLDLIGTLPVLLLLRKLLFLANPSFWFLSLLVLHTPNFEDIISCFSIHFSFVLSGKVFLFFTSLYYHLKSFPQFEPPPPPFIEFRNFFRPLLLFDTLDCKNSFKSRR